jgi:hypothetical protein
LTEFDSADLKRSFRDPPEGARAADHCPEPATILQAVLGELSVTQNRSVADHAAVCPPCTVAWRLAREYAAEAEFEGRTAAEADYVPRRTGLPVLRWLPAAAIVAAVTLTMVVLVPWPWKESPAPPVLRSLEYETIESLVPDGSTLPTDGFVLRWTPGPDGARYAVRVTDRRLDHLAETASLDRPEFTVPESALAALAPGSLVLWQVEMILPDGRRLASMTFATRLD